MEKFANIRTEPPHVKRPATIPWDRRIHVNGVLFNFETLVK